MTKLDLIRNVLDNEVKEYLEASDCFESRFNIETDLDFESDGIDYEAKVSIQAKFQLTKEYETDDCGNRHNMGTSRELVNYQYEIIDLLDLESGRYLIEDKNMSKELEEAA